MDKQTRLEMGAEFLGTFFLMALGLGSVAQAHLGGAKFGGMLSINLTWGIAVALGIAVAGKLSGAHLNPAVTLACAVHRDFPWRKVAGYVLAQLLGAFLAAGVVYLVYLEGIQAFDGGTRAVLGETGTAGIFATYPSAHLSAFPGGFLDQFFGTFLLMLGVFAIGDERNAGWAKMLAPLMVGLIVAGIGMSFAFNAGYAINPARDFGPRLFTFVAGWGSGVFRAGDGWWWVPVVAPCLGAIAAGFAYDGLLAPKAETAPAARAKSSETSPAT